MPTRVVPGSGAVLQPTFDSNYGVLSINVIDGGSGYASTDPPKITIQGTNTPIVEGVFYPVINPSGQIARIVVIEPGSGYTPISIGSGQRIGIETTAFVESSLIVQKGLDTGTPYISVASSESNILLGVLGGEGSSIYENGYNIAISTTVVGSSASITPDFSLNQNRFYGFSQPFPAYSTSGIGTGATFNVFIVYDSGTGIPISTSVILRNGGNSYSVGDTVSISGTFMNGTSPQNDLSFNVSSVANTRIVSAANSAFLNLPSTTLIGFGTGATFNVTRDSFGDITIIDVVNGGSGYALTDKISIAGTYIGGSTPQDNLLISPAVLGTDKLPSTLYVIKTSDNSFKVSGLSTSNQLNLVSYGSGTNSLTFDNPNASSLISIDNLIQSPLSRRDLVLNLASSIGVSTDILFVSSGLSSITTFDILKINSELMSVKNIGFGYTNAIQVNRGALGSRVDAHFNNSKIDILRGNFNIVKDTLYFSGAPFGPTGPEGLTVNSKFSGRAFTRQFEPGLENDKNIIFDDISKDFVSASSTEFFLKSEGEKVVGIYTDTNSLIVGNVDINNNPLILINGVPQISEKDFTVDTPGNNRLKFLSGFPVSGKISRVGISTGYGYQPLVAAGATVTVGKGLSESSYTSNFLNVGSVDNKPNGIVFDPTGTKLYIVGQQNNKIYQYNLSSPYNLSTAGLAASCPTAGENTPTGIFFKPDGTQVFYTGSSGDNIRRAILPTPWSLVGASSTTVVIPASTITSITGSSEATPTGLFIRPDGKKVYLLGSVLDRVFQLTLNTGWDFNTINLGLSTSFGFNLVETGPTGIKFSPDGSRMYLCGNASSFNQPLGISTGEDRVHGFTLSTPWEVSTAVYNDETFLISEDILPTDIEFNSFRNKMYILGDTNDKIYEYNLKERGAIESISLLGNGSGYRTPPEIKLLSPVGSGASFAATIGAGGTITGISIINPGLGYTANTPPNVVIGIPTGYSDLSLEYINGSSGNGTGAKASVVVGNQSNIIQFELEEPGNFYKVGDVLRVSGLTTDPSIGIGFSEFRVTVENTVSDKFSGFYPGQFIQFDDISPFFNGVKKKFTLSVTQGTITEVLSLKVDPSTDLKLENNLFIYLNDVLQEPGVSYTFNGSKVIFKEAPKQNSKCAVLFYKGSDLDIEQIDPPKTIKPGDQIQIIENILDPLDRSQFERIVKRIISSDSLDTFTYDSIGISTDQTKERPLVWTKQTSDLIINGVLYSKSRPDLTSRIIPTTKLIKNVATDDEQIYVNNAFPLFVSVDNITEELKDIQIINNKSVSPAISTAIVSAGSTIESISINEFGFGYENSTVPFVAISSSLIKKKDPIYNWKSVQTGIGSEYNLNSVIYSDRIVSVGSSGIIGISSNGLDWISSRIGVGQTTTFNSISGNNGLYYAVGNDAKIAYLDSSSGFSTSSWQSVRLLKQESILGSPEPVISVSSYSNAFNDIVYSPQKNVLICVGDNKGLFSAVGLGTTTFFEKVPPVFVDLNSVTINDRTTGFISGLLFVAVGDSGNIIYSSDGEIWARALAIPTTRNLNKIIWDSFRFVVVGNNATILTSVNGITGWEKVNTNITDDLVNIKYEYGIYIALNSVGELFFSYDLSHWVKRSTNQQNKIKDFVFIPPSESKDISDGRSIIVGFGATVLYAEPIYNRAVAISSVSSGSISSISIVQPGFGYEITSPPPVIVEGPGVETEKILSIKAVGDFGTINYVGVGASTIDFELHSEMYDNSSLGIGYSSLNSYGVNYSQLNVGDYFVIYESNSIIGHAITGITTSLGGLSNYPASRVGTAVSYLDGVYKVEKVSSPSAGIVTVRCNFTFGPNNIPLQVNINTNTNGIYGRYTWGKIFDYQNRTRLSPKKFYVQSNNGLVGLSTAPDVARTRGVF